MFHYVTINYTLIFITDVKREWDMIAVLQSCVDYMRDPEMPFSIKRDSKEEQNDRGYCTMRIGQFPKNDVEYEYYFSLRDENMVGNIILEVSKNFLKSK